MDPAIVWGLLAGIAFVPPLLFMLWARAHERHAREPLGPVVGVFAYGATLGIAIALVLGLLLGALSGATVLLAAVVIAPLVEEASKARGLGFVRRHIDEPEDGLVYGIAVGLGFAATETLLYGLMELRDTDPNGAFAVVIARNFSSMLLHAASSALLGFGYARMRLSGGGRGVLMPFYLLAVALHAVYNGLVLTVGWVGFLSAILMVMVVMGLLLRKVRRLDEHPATSGLLR